MGPKAHNRTVRICHGQIDVYWAKWPMPNSRCMECNSVVTKDEATCWVCGEPVPGAKKSLLAWLLRPKKPESGKVSKIKSRGQNAAARG